MNPKSYYYKLVNNSLSSALYLIQITNKTPQIIKHLNWLKYKISRKNNWHIRPLFLCIDDKKIKSTSM